VVLAVALLLAETPSSIAPAGATAAWCVTVEVAAAVTVPLTVITRVPFTAMDATSHRSLMVSLEQPAGRPPLSDSPEGMG
jgi:hypothetical protein